MDWWIKKGKHFDKVELQEMVIGCAVKKAKLNDVRKLLEKHYGDTWADHPQNAYLKQILESTNEQNAEEEEDDVEPYCEKPTSSEPDQDLQVWSTGNRKAARISIVHNCDFLTVCVNIFNTF